MSLKTDAGFLTRRELPPRGPRDIGPGPPHACPFTFAHRTPGPTPDKELDRRGDDSGQAHRGHLGNPTAATDCHGVWGPSTQVCPPRKHRPHGPGTPMERRQTAAHIPGARGHKLAFLPLGPFLLQPPPVASAKCRPIGPEFRRKCPEDRRGVTRMFLRNPRIFTRGGKTAQNLTYSCHVISARCREKGREPGGRPIAAALQPPSGQHQRLVA